MKTRILLPVLSLMLAANAFSQSSGTIAVSGSNPEAISVTNTSDTVLSSTVNLGTLTPATGSSLVTGSTQVRLRSNKAYTVSAQATAISFVGAGSADGGTSLALSDIGFGISSTDASGANVANATGHSVVSLFNYDPSTAAVSNGLTPFVSGTHGTLSDLSSSTQIMSGPRISKQGNVSTNNNFVLLTMKMATLPQYFTPNTSFATTNTLTVALQ